MRLKIWTFGVIATLLITVSCLDPFAPPVSDKEIDFMVVDGFINSGNKSAVVKLSKAVPLDAKTTGVPVKKAVVQIEGEDGVIIPLPETVDGTYAASSINVQNGKKYQLRFKTNGKEYLSDPLVLKLSPVLDEVSWRAEPNGVWILVDSHDVEGTTQYYQWTFTETWEYNADYQSAYDFVNGQAIPRRVGDLIYTCYNTATSTRVLVTSTTTNTADIVNDFELTFIPKGSKKVSQLYSILVQQRALDEQAYNYWKNLQKSTENLGGLFDPLPSEVAGNVHNVNDSEEPVLGYFAGGEVQEKRIFIRRTDLPADLRVVDRFDCFIDTVYTNQLSMYSYLALLNGYGSPTIAYYTHTSEICIDCRKQGGVLQKPSFWPR